MWLEADEFGGTVKRKPKSNKRGALVEKKSSPPVHEARHCDDYIDDQAAPAALRAYLERARSPAHGMMAKDPYPTLFADYQDKRVRVVMASRFGDVGITDNLKADFGYQARVSVDQLSNFGDTP